MKKKMVTIMLAIVMVAGLFAGRTVAADKPILKIGYSNWAGWVAWEIGVQKGWFKEAGVDARFFWFKYAASLRAFSTNKLDAVCITNIDLLVVAASGKSGKAIMINDYSNGSDMIVAKAGIKSVKDLKGRIVALEVGLLEQLLLRKALEKNGMSESDIHILDIPTDKLPLALKVKRADAIVAWQPYSREAIKGSTGAKAIFSSADVPGLIYDLLFVADESLKAYPAAWKKVVQVWFRIVDFIRNPKNRGEVLKIMGKRVGVPPTDYEPMLEGAFLLDLEGNKKVYKEGDDLDSIYGSTMVADRFNVAVKNYRSAQDIKRFIYPRLIMSMK